MKKGVITQTLYLRDEASPAGKNANTRFLQAMIGFAYVEPKLEIGGGTVPKIGMVYAENLHDYVETQIAKLENA